MRIREKQTRTTEVNAVVDLICNKCGESMAMPKPGGGIRIDRGVDRTYLGLVEGEVDGCYDSEHLVDTHRYRFEMCEKCIVELFNGFKVPPTVIEYFPMTDQDTATASTWEEDRKMRSDLDECADPLEMWECSCENPIRVTVGPRSVFWHRNLLFRHTETFPNGTVEMHLECMNIAGRGNDEDEAYRQLDKMFHDQLEFFRLMDGLPRYLLAPHWKVRRRPADGWERQQKDVEE